MRVGITLLRMRENENGIHLAKTMLVCYNLYHKGIINACVLQVKRLMLQSKDVIAEDICRNIMMLKKYINRPSIKTRKTLA